MFVLLLYSGTCAVRTIFQVSARGRHGAFSTFTMGLALSGQPPCHNKCTLLGCRLQQMYSEQVGCPKHIVGLLRRLGPPCTATACCIPTPRVLGRMVSAVLGVCLQTAPSADCCCMACMFSWQHLAATPALSSLTPVMPGRHVDFSLQYHPKPVENIDTLARCAVSASTGLS
jgi:hypothetical protein